MQGFHNVRDVLDAHGGQVKHLTVLAPANDPFRVDTRLGTATVYGLANTLTGIGITRQRHPPWPVTE
jgi:hypothetical protein